MFTQYEMEVLTPVHIGSGYEILPIEYVYSKSEAKFIKINMDALMRDKKIDLIRFREEVTTPNFSLNSFFPQARNFALYELSADKSGLHELETQKRVRESISDASGWYIPGSSLKGALRTLVYKANMDKAMSLKLSKKIEEKINDPKARREWAASLAEKRLTGSPQESLFRTIRVGDSSVLKQQQMGLFTVKVLSRKYGGGFWWKQLPRQNVAQSAGATPIFFEGIQPGVKLTGGFRNDDSILDNQKNVLKGTEYLYDIWAKIRACQAHYMQEERFFFADIGLGELSAEYDRLVGINKVLGENEIIMQIGWGTGYKVKTLKEGISEELFTNVIKKYKMMRREGFAYPKTRKVIFREGKPATVPGYVKLSFV